MASLSYRQLQIVEDYLEQIHHAILDLKEWNKGIDSPDKEAVTAFSPRNTMETSDGDA